MDIKVHKDFMNPFLFLKLKEIMNSAEFPWFKSRIVPQIDDVQLIHTFFEFDRINSQFFELLDPCITFLKVKKLIRAKANLVLKTNEIQEHGFHIDTKGYEKFRSAILYVNSNNGYTRFEKKNKKIKSEENKLIDFNGLLQHTGTSCTDAPYRIVINFVYT